MTRQAVTGLITGFILMILSTLAYYIPVYVAGLPGYDLSQVPSEFYEYYCWTTSGNLLLVAIYSAYLFFMTNSRLYVVKIIFLWMMTAEIFTFALHVFNKFFAFKAYDGFQIIQICVFFIICFSWFVSRTLHVDKSAKFFPDSTYTLKFKPKNLFGIFNHLVNLRGHAAIYQDGLVYKFRRKSGRIEPRKISPESVQILIKSGQLSIENVSRNERIEDLTGRKYRFFTYNCNHLAKDARRKKA